MKQSAIDGTVMEQPTELPTGGTAPRKIVPAAPEDQWEEYRLPQLPAKKRGAEVDYAQAMEWFEAVPAGTARNRIELYVYRCYPIIHRPSGSHYIERLSLPLWSRDHILTNHGGGKYRVDVLERGAKRGDKLFSFTTELDWQASRPKIAPGELALEDPNNRGYLEFLKSTGQLTPDGKLKPADSDNGKAAPTDTSAALSTLMNAITYGINISKASDKPVTADGFQQYMLEKLKRDNPNQSTASITALIAAITPLLAPIINSMMNKPSNGSDKVMELLVACRGEFVSMLRGGGVGQSTSIEMVGRSWSKRECSG